MSETSKTHTLPSGRQFIEEVSVVTGKKGFILTSKDGERVSAVLDGADIDSMYGILYPEKKSSEYFSPHPELSAGAPNSACDNH